MKKHYKIQIILLFVFLLGILLRYNAISQELSYEPATKIDFIITTFCTYNVSTGLFKYEYKLYSKPASLQNMWHFVIETQVSCTEINAPSGWLGDYCEKLPTVSHPIVSWGSESELFRLRPGKFLEGFSFQSRGIPGIVTSYNQGYVPHRWYPEGMAVDEDLPPKWPENSVQKKTIGPVHPPPEPVDGVSFIDRIISLKHQAFQLGWITNAGIKNSLDQKLDNAKKKLQQKMNNAAKNILFAFINELEAQRGKHLDDNAFYLLKVNAEFLISKL